MGRKAAFLPHFLRRGLFSTLFLGASVPSDSALSLISIPPFTNLPVS